MELVKHETCLEYFRRRLSEGWRCISLEGHNAVLLSPDGIRRELDLRNDVETLRPNAAGDLTGCMIGGSSPAPTNWQSVDEEVADDGVTWVYNTSSGGSDLYNLPASSGSGTINKITVIFRWRGDYSPPSTGGAIKPKIKSNSTVTDGPQINASHTNWRTDSREWAVNPADSQPWEWADIDALQIGQWCGKNAVYKYGSSFCTQIYVEVDYVGIVEKTGSDSGSGADAKKTGNPLATMSRSETGSGAEASTEEAAYSRDEVGNGVDAWLSFLVALAKSETGSGADGHKAVAPQSAGETGEGVDALFALLAAMVRAETGSGIEHILDRDLVLTEVGSGVETVVSFLRTLISDSGTGVENSYLHILEGVRDSSDSGSGVEASSLAALLQRDETGEGAEVVAARALFSREPQMGAIDLARVITAAITGAETGTGAEASLVAFYQKVTESGEGAEVSSLVGLFTGEDSGAGAEAITLLAAMVSHDTGVSVESVLSFFKKAIDSGQGEENLHLIGFVGRAMKLITYLRAYSDLVVYTKPYSDLRVYTSEVKQ